MQRLLVIILAGFDALIAVAVGAAVALTALTLVWVFGMGDPQWPALWPAAGTVWQLGHLVPLSITLPGEYLALTGIAADAASFTLSLAPLGFAAFTAIFAARSGARAARAGAWVTGVCTGTLVTAVLATVIALTCRNPVAAVHLWQAVIFPTLVFAIPALGGAVRIAWRDGDDGPIDAVRTWMQSLPGQWGATPGLIARGSAIAVTGLLGLGALAVVVALAFRGGDVIALFETGHVNALGATVVTLGQLAYLPTLIVWALCFVAGPGFALGVETAVTPAGTQLGVVPAIPLLGAVPESASPWLLSLVLAPVVVGGLAGWAVRGRIGIMPEQQDAVAAVPVHPALAGLLPERAAEREPDIEDDSGRPLAGRLGQAGAGRSERAGAGRSGQTGLLATVAVGIAVVTAGVAALLAVVASGSLGPGRLAETGPSAGPVALAVGAEVLVGAGIVLLTTHRATGRAGRRRARNRDVEQQVADADGFATASVGADGFAAASVTGSATASVAPATNPGSGLLHGKPRTDYSRSLLDDLRDRVEENRSSGGESPPESPSAGLKSSSDNGGASADETDTAPVPLPDPATLGPRRTAPLPDPATLGPRRPTPLPPID